MLKVNVVAVGTLKERYLREACAEYTKRLGRFVKLTVTELAESVPLREAAEIKAHLRGRIILLDVTGREYSSTELAAFLSEIKNITSEVTLIIGGSNGVSEEIRALSDDKISFSRLTFPHQLFRVFVLEQLYRAETIQNGLVYHK